jgi:hypothetical protein
LDGVPEQLLSKSNTRLQSSPLSDDKSLERERMGDEVKESDWDRAEFYASCARKEVLKFNLRQVLAWVFALVIGLTVISVAGLFTRWPEGLLIAFSATASFLWWKFVRPLLQTPTDLTCPACGRNAAMFLKRKTSAGYEWDLSCAQCGNRVETRVGDA